MDETHKPTGTSKKSTRIIDSGHETTLIIVPPDGGWGWLVVFGAFVSYFLADGLQYSYGVFLQDIATSLNSTTSQVSLTGGICSCVFCVSGPFSAALVNRYGYRVISIVGAILASVSLALTSFSYNIYYVIFYHGFIGGVGFGMIYITALIAVGFYFERWRGLATSIAVCGAGIGAITLPPLLTITMRKIGWRHTYQWLSGFSLIIIGCGCLFRPLKPTRVALTHPRESRSEQSTARSAKASYVSFFEKYQNKNFNTLVDQRSVYNDSSEQLFSTTFTADTTLRNDSFQSRKEGRRCCCCRCGSCRHRRYTTAWKSRPIYRDDIFFTGSLATVPEYKSAQHFESRPNLEYQLSVTRMPTHQPQDTASHKCKCCPNAVRRTLATMLDFRVLKSYKFQLLVLNAVFVSLGHYIPYMFIKDNALQHGIAEDIAAWLISSIGITNTLGRIICGLLSTSSRISSMAMCYVFLFIGGIVTIGSTISYVLWVQFSYCAIFGLAMSSTSALRTLIIVKMVGLENLTNAVGIILLFQGFASLLGLAIAGQLWDMTHDYKYAFYFGGSCLSFAAIFLVILHAQEMKEEKKTEQTNPQTSNR